MASDKMTVNLKVDCEELLAVMESEEGRKIICESIGGTATIQGRPFTEQFTRNDWMCDQFGTHWLVTDVQEAYIDVKSRETKEVKRVTGLTYNDQGCAIFTGETVLPAVTQRNGFEPTRFDTRAAVALADRLLAEARTKLKLHPGGFVHSRELGTSIMTPSGTDTYSAVDGTIRFYDAQGKLLSTQQFSQDDYTKFDSPGNFAPRSLQRGPEQIDPWALKDEYCTLGKSKSKVFDRMVDIKAGMRDRIARNLAISIHKLLNADPVIGIQTHTEVNEDDEQDATDRLHKLLAGGNAHA